MSIFILNQWKAYDRVNTNYKHTHGFGTPLALAWIWISFGFGSALALDNFWLWLSFGLSLTLNLSKLSFFKCCSILCGLAIMDKKNCPNELGVDLF